MSPGAPRSGGYGDFLTPAHERLLRQSKIAAKVARQRGYKSLSDTAQLAAYGFSGVQARPGLLVPVHRVDPEEPPLHQLRPDKPRLVDGKPIKYETPAGEAIDLDVHPSIRRRVHNPANPLWITEGVRKADAAISAGLTCIALLGVWNWQRGGVPLDAWKAILLDGRDVFVAFDSDAMTKREVGAALDKLGGFLLGEGARVTRVYLPPGEDGSKVGLDDYLAAGHSVTELLKLAHGLVAVTVEDREVDKRKDRLRVEARARREFAAEERTAALSAGRRRAPVDGATFVLDAPATVDALWGLGPEVLWAAGEGLLIVGPQGVGKTTVAQQLILRRIGLRNGDLFGYPVAEDERRVLCLAMDRPRQFRRSLHRMVTEEDRATLKERLVVWEGPLPFDPLVEPTALSEWITTEIGSDIGTVVADSYKDLAPGLVGDEPGARLNLAVQEVISREIEWLGLHHQRKATGDNKRPNTLADVYGSTWLTAGLGSVLLLWGTPGASTVEAVHLKQPAEIVGPLTVSHDRSTGAPVAATPESLAVGLLTTAGQRGVTKVEVAVGVYGSEESSDQKKAERLLGRMTDRYGLVHEYGEKGGSGGGGRPARWVLR